MNSLLTIILSIGKLIKNKNASFVFKTNSELDIEGERIKHIKSQHKGGYILIRWNE